tara:strand:+ start:12 stop:431 length:420 start_codon:yes stop_codon:yes gene_type:complete
MSDNERIIKFISDITNCYELSSHNYNEAESLLHKYRGAVCDKQEKAVKEDLVNNPKHYMLFADGMESFDVIRKTLTLEEYIGFLKGNILKYRLRAGKKGDASICIAKSDWYADKLAGYVESQKQASIDKDWGKDRSDYD